MMLSGIVVAGGASRRLGQDKRKLRLWGHDGPTLLEHTLMVLAPLCRDRIVVLNDADEWGHLPARLIPDEYANAGAIGGVYTGLIHARYPHALVVAADMPLLNPHLLSEMARYPRRYDALVPGSLVPAPDQASTPVCRAEPLHAIYNRACVRTLRTALERGDYRLTRILQHIQTLYLHPREVSRHDPDGHSFLNINTPTDLENVRSILHSKKPYAYEYGMSPPPREQTPQHRV